MARRSASPYDAPPPSRDAAATRARLLTAAVDEFAARGLAGGRVDRIAAAARANKRAIYDYFGSKDALFDAAVFRVAGDLNAAVPLSGDLVAWAGDLFDYVNEHPEVPRMISWRRLERPPGALPISETFVTQVATVGDEAAAAGVVPGAADGDGGAIAVVDLVILVIGLANAWDLSGRDVARPDGSDPDDPARIAAQRAAVVEAARRLVTRS